MVARRRPSTRKLGLMTRRPAVRQADQVGVRGAERERHTFRGATKKKRVSRRDGWPARRDWLLLKGQGGGMGDVVRYLSRIAIMARDKLKQNGSGCEPRCTLRLLEPIRFVEPVCQARRTNEWELSPTTRRHAHDSLVLLAVMLAARTSRSAPPHGSKTEKKGQLFRVLFCITPHWH